MSNLEAGLVAQQPDETRAGGLGGVTWTPTRDLINGREVVLGGPRGMPVIRTLPHRDRRMVGAWCFVDHFDATAAPGTPMRVPPHPHTGLQTVTWLVQGGVRHRDSLGNDQLIQPGQLNLMTAGQGIAHAEDSLPDHGPVHGAQLWVALDDRHRAVPPDFEHHADLPVLRDDGVAICVFMGELTGDAGSATSPAKTFSPLMGAQLTLDPGRSTRLSLHSRFEYAALTLTGTAAVDGVPLGTGPLLYLGCGRTHLTVTGDPEPGPAAKLLLLGGEPFDERIVMWWNFIGRSHDEIVASRTDWMAELASPTAGRFGRVPGYDGPALPAPELPTTPLLPRGR